VVEIDAALIEPSPFADRLSAGETDDPDFAALKDSIAAHGQQVPVLLRPHADADKAARGLYQAAYGHRRVQAARALGRPVRAVVRTLDDAALALAQLHRARLLRPHAARPRFRPRHRAGRACGPQIRDDAAFAGG
jgi:ParB family chromosome partitioning protein